MFYRPSFILLLCFQQCFSFLENPPTPAVTMPTVEESLKFVAMGDWGGINFHPFTTPIQESLADQMAILAERNGTAFNVLLGDNFYLFGVESVDDPRFNDTFENVYKGKWHQMPWYVIAGNHDYFGNVSAQIAYSKRSDRWTFPDYYHLVRKSLADGTVVEIVMIDTIQLCGNVYTLDRQPAGPADNKAAEAQWTWIEQQLNTSRANYLLVAGHFPVHSVAEHGPTDCLISRLEPMLYRYNVSAYLAGHDHNLQHIQMTKSGQTMNYFIAGAGNFVDDATSHLKSVPDGGLKFHWAELLYFGGFSYFDVTQTRMRVSFIDGIGANRYQYDISPRL